MKCWEYINDNIPYIDTENGVAAGASFGGFMANWIQGKDLGREFKALVSHDGTFVAEAKIGTEELFFMQHDVCIVLLFLGSVYLTWSVVQRHLLGGA